MIPPKSVHPVSTRFRALIWGLFVASSAASPGCGSSRAPDAPRNVIVILADTLRADRLSCYGYEKATSPALDGLAQEGVLFERAYASASYTPASTGSALTGQYPLTHGYLNGGYRLADSAMTLAELLSEEGLQTGAVVGNLLVGKRYGLDQGFDEFVELWDRDLKQHHRGSPLLADEAVRRSLDMIEGFEEDPFFLYMHLMDPHEPEHLPDEWYDPAFRPRLENGIRSPGVKLQMNQWSTAAHPRVGAVVRPYVETYSELYDVSVRYMDTYLASFFSELERRGLWEDTLIVLISDHGEQLLEHGYFGHGNTPYDEVLQVPWIMRHPQREPWSGVRVQSPVSLVDLLPTIAELMGTEIPANVEGRSLVTLMNMASTGEEEPTSPPIFSEGAGYDGNHLSTLTQTVREDGDKLIWNREHRRKELFDLDKDPKETQNRFAEDPERAEALLDTLTRSYNWRLQRFAPEVQQVTALMAARIQELGYVAPSPSGGSRVYREMTCQTLDPFGLYGDERETERYSSVLDFLSTHDRDRRFSHEQILFDPPMSLEHARQGRGLWVGLESVFLLPNRDGRGYVVLDVIVEETLEEKHIGEISVEVNGRGVGSQQFESLGSASMRFALDDELKRLPYLQVRVHADWQYAAYEFSLIPRPDAIGERRRSPQVAFRIMRLALED